MRRKPAAILIAVSLISVRVVAQESPARLNVVQAGTGEAVVLVPGLLGSAFGFRKLIAPLVERGLHVIVVEPLGVGGSDKPATADYSLTAQADRIAGALEALGVEQAVVVAHSVGASIALRLAYRHPGRVRAIVSLDGGPAEAAATAGFRRAMRFAFLIKLFGGVERNRKTVRSTLRDRSADPDWVTDEVVAGYMAGAAADLEATLQAYRQMAKAREPEPLSHHLFEVRCPVRLLIGTADQGISEAEIQLLATRLPSFAVERVPRAGHFVYEESPAAVVAAIDRILASAEAETTTSAERAVQIGAAIH